MVAEESARRRDMDLTTMSIPMVVTPGNQHNVQEECDYQIFTKYLNYSGRPISMGFRNGLVVKVPPRTHRMRSQFVIRYEHHFTERIKHDVRDFIVGHRGETNEDFKRFKEQFLKCYQEQENGLRVGMDYYVTLDQLQENGGCVYWSELDIILSSSKDVLPLHPFCYESLVTQPGVGSTKHGSGVRIYIVDNLGRIGDRYARVLDEIILVKSGVNSLKQDGLYIENTNIVDSSLSVGFNKIKYFSESEVDGLAWLHRTYSLAHQTLDPDGARDVEMRQRDFEFKKLELEGKRIAAQTAAQRTELDNDKLQHDLNKMVQERQTLLLQAQLEEQERVTKIAEDKLKREHAEREHVSKLDQMRSKDYFEERAAVRKDSSEWVKFIPVMIGLAGASFFGFKNWLDN